MTFHPASSTLAIAGDGTGPAAITFSAWRLSSGKLQQLFSIGRPVAVPSGGFFSKAPPLPLPWDLVFSPLGDYVAVAGSPGGLRLVCLTSKCLVDGAEEFAGQRVAAGLPGQEVG
jgi:hypothetical protein